MNLPHKRRNFDQKYKISNKNDMVSAWRNFKNIFSRPLFTIISRPEILKFHPYSILTGETMVRFVIYCVLSCNIQNWVFRPYLKTSLVSSELLRIITQEMLSFPPFALGELSFALTRCWIDTLTQKNWGSENKLLIWL